MADITKGLSEKERERLNTFLSQQKPQERAPGVLPWRGGETPINAPFQLGHTKEQKAAWQQRSYSGTGGGPGVKMPQSEYARQLLNMPAPSMQASHGPGAPVFTPPVASPEKTAPAGVAKNMTDSPPASKAPESSVAKSAETALAKRVREPSMDAVRLRNRAAMELALEQGLNGQVKIQDKWSPYPEFDQKVLDERIMKLGLAQEKEKLAEQWRQRGLFGYPEEDLNRQALLDLQRRGEVPYDLSSATQPWEKQNIEAKIESWKQGRREMALRNLDLFERDPHHYSRDGLHGLPRENQVGGGFDGYPKMLSSTNTLVREAKFGPIEETIDPNYEVEVIRGGSPQRVVSNDVFHPRKTGRGGRIEEEAYVENRPPTVIPGTPGSYSVVRPYGGLREFGSTYEADAGAPFGELVTQAGLDKTTQETLTSEALARKYVNEAAYYAANAGKDEVEAEWIKKNGPPAVAAARATAESLKAQFPYVESDFDPDTGGKKFVNIDPRTNVGTPVQILSPEATMSTSDQWRQLSDVQRRAYYGSLKTEEERALFRSQLDPELRAALDSYLR